MDWSSTGPVEHWADPCGLVERWGRFGPAGTRTQPSNAMTESSSVRSFSAEEAEAMA